MHGFHFRRLWPMLLCATLALPAAGCMLFTTKAEGAKLRKQVNALQRKLDAMNKRDADLKRAMTELKELKGVLPQAKAILLRNSARFGAKLDRLAADVDKLKGRLENVETDLGSATKSSKSATARLTKIAETLARIKTEVTRLMAEVRKKPKPGPKTADELFAAGNIARLTGRYAQARTHYAALISRFPRHKRVEAAYYFTAKTYFDAYDYRATVVAVSRQLRKYKKGRLAARGRLLSGRSYFELKRCKTAIRILARLVRLFPNAEVSPQAKTLLARVRKVRFVSRYCSR